MKLCEARQRYLLPGRQAGDPSGDYNCRTYAVREEMGYCCTYTRGNRPRLFGLLLIPVWEEGREARGFTGTHVY